MNPAVNKLSTKGNSPDLSTGPVENSQQDEPLLGLGGLTPRQFAAITLRVTCGVPWLDPMIEEAQREYLRAVAMGALMTHNSIIELARRLTGEYASTPWDEGDIAAFAREQVDAMVDNMQLPLI